MTSLALTSDIAWQTLVVYCDGIVAWFDEDSQSTEAAITLLGLNEHVFDTANLNDVRVLQDGCKVRIFNIPFVNSSNLPFSNIVSLQIAAF